MRRLTAFLDKRLAKYRPPEPEEEPFTPKTKEELISVLARSSEEVLAKNERNLIAGAMSFSSIPVADILDKKHELTFIYEKDVLSPKMLDRLYKTKQDYYPVLNKEEKLLGLLEIDDFDALQMAEDKVSDHINSDLCFVRGDYSLEMALAALLRSNKNFAVVIDRDEEIIGFVDLSLLLFKLLGSYPKESFDRDESPTAVAKRDKR